MKEQLKQLRKKLKLNQQEFADRIGINRGTLANYEVGRNEPIDAVINLICGKFRVNETWLRTGQGEMFIEISRDDELLRLIDESMAENLGDLKRRLALAIMKLTPEQMKMCKEWIEDSFNLVDRNDSAEPDDVESTIEEKVAAYRAELEAEAASKGKSSASQTAAGGVEGTGEDDENTLLPFA